MDRIRSPLTAQREGTGKLIQSIDQLGNRVELVRYPKRIVSLVPSQTELLYDLGLDEEVVGITKFCQEPPTWRKSKTLVGGTKHVWMDVVEKLSPDLIIANKEENSREEILYLAEKFPVWTSNVISFEDALQMIGLVGHMVGREATSSQLIVEIRRAFQSQLPIQPLKALYFIWKDPWMAAGGKTFIDSMMKSMGLVNVLRQDRYPELTLEMIRELNPQLILLPSEPYPFSGKHADELKQALPHAEIVTVDGTMFSWYGSRLRKAPAYFRFRLFPFGNPGH